MTVLAIGSRIAKLNGWCRREPSITEILSDSIVKDLMKADGIDPKELEAELRRMVLEISVLRHAGQIGSPATAPAEP
jgi:hypothetical protein